MRRGTAGTKILPDSSGYMVRIKSLRKAGVLLVKAHMTEIPKYVPTPIAGVLRRLQKDRPRYVENLIAFFKLRAEGAFLGREDEWVLIHGQSIVHFLPHENSIMELDGGAYPDAAFQPVNDETLRREKKRQSSILHPCTAKQDAV